MKNEEPKILQEPEEIKEIQEIKEIEEIEEIKEIQETTKYNISSLSLEHQIAFIANNMFIM
jgi:hypothetical protein